MTTTGGSSGSGSGSGSASASSESLSQNTDNNASFRPPEQPQQRGKHQQHDRNQPSSIIGFLLEPIPTVARSNAKRHFNDAFGYGESGLNYGPRSELEDDLRSSNGNGKGIIGIGRYGEDDDGGELCAADVEVGEELGEKPTEVAACVGKLANFKKGEKRMVGYETMGGKVIGKNGKEAPRGHSNDAFTFTAVKNIDLQQLEEEVGVHEATLESLTLKLRTLRSHVQSEEHNFTSLKEDVALLEERQEAFRRRTDTNQKLVKDLEASLEKCLQKLRRALDALVVVGQVDLNSGLGGDGNAAKVVRLFLPPSGEGEADESICQEEVDDQKISKMLIVDQCQKTNDNAVRRQQIPLGVNLQEDKGDRHLLSTNHAIPATNNYSLVPLTYTCFPSGMALAFLVQASHACKSKTYRRKFIQKRELRDHNLPTDFPDLSMNHDSTPLLHRINSEAFICGIMNVAVLEHFLEIEKLQKSDCVVAAFSGGDDRGEQQLQLPKTCGWINESRSIWGTLLDLYAQFDQKDLFSQCQGVGDKNEGKTAFFSKGPQAIGKRSSPRRMQNNVDRIDPNVILCPYEIGGKCADDQCPYQHLRQDSSNTEEEFSQAAMSRRKWIILSSKNSGNEHDWDEERYYVRYNNLPKPQLPLTLSNIEFTIQRPKEGGTDLKNDAVAQDIPAPSSVYDCLTCVDPPKTYYRGDFEGDQMSFLEINQKDNAGVSVIQNVQQNAPDDDCYDFHGVSIQQGIDEDDNSAVMRNYSPESQFKLEHDESVSIENMLEDDTNETVQGSDSRDERNTCVRMASDEGSHNSNAVCGVQNNLDYVSLPSIADGIDDCDSHVDSNTEGNIDDEHKSILSDMFWWQQQELHNLFLESAQAPEREDSHTDTFGMMLRAFGFQKRCPSEKRGDEDARQSYLSLQCTILSASNDSSISSLQQDALLFSRIVDFSRLCIHMGRDSFALSALDGVCQPRAKDDPITALLMGASQSIKTLCHVRCSTVFQVQVYLLLVSESLHVHHDCLCNADDVSVVDHRKIETLVDQIAHLTDRDKFMAKNMLPAGFDAVSQRLASGLLSVTSKSTAEKENNDIEWMGFVKTLKFTVEKFILVPFSQLRTSTNLHDQLSFLMQCVCIGKFLEQLLGNSASKKSTFAPYLHGLEPIWRSLQRLLQSSPGQGFKGWLQPDLVAIVTIGPVLLACVADAIVTCPCNDIFVSSTPLRKLPPELDPRLHATVSLLDGLIVGILKELSRFGRLRGSHGRFSESLLTPLYALSATLCIALGSFEKAHHRLSNLLGSNSEKCPSMYAVSEMIWSQLVQIRMICPSYSFPLKMITEKRSDNELISESLPEEVLQTHHRIASRIVESGIFLWGVKLRGDSCMNIMLPGHNQLLCQERAKSTRPVLFDGSENGVEHCPPAVELCISDLYPGLLGAKGRAAVFPESVLLLGKTLTKLSLEKCGLRRLPFSLGYHMTNLQLLNLSNNLLLELPSSVGLMIQLEVLDISYNCLKTFPKVNHCRNLRVIDVSHNQLMSFPADLALECHNLQSFHVGGNPAASDILLSPQK